jgi:hypothetical protein|tara:strand:+ start:11861 stop:12238 length:378 start_codon:yes stop_codon:yes gene_type:complete
MAKFSIYQIQLSTAQYAAINGNNTVPAFEARNAMMMDFKGHKIGGIASDAFEAGYYTHVCNIEAKDYNEVFHIGNMGPEENIERLSRMSSLSVGDVIVAEDGTVAVVAPIGFVAFSHNPKMSAMA